MWVLLIHLFVWVQKNEKTKGWMGVCVCVVGVWLIFLMDVWFANAWRLDHVSCFLSSPSDFISSDVYGLLGFIATTPDESSTN